LRYKPWGETRYTLGSTVTNYQYTGQRNDSDSGLYYYGARWYDSYTGRFAQADSIIPPGVLGYDRYAYVYNNPVMRNDPTGHFGPIVALLASPPALIVATAIFVAALLYPPTHKAMTQAITNAIDSVSEMKRRPTAQENAASEIEANSQLDGDGWLVPFKNPCNSSVKMKWACGIGIGVGVGLGTYAATHGGCGQDESNSDCPPHKVPPVPAPTATQTPTNTPTSTPSCPPWNQCPTQISTSTSTQTSTPTRTPSPTRTLSPVFSPSILYTNQTSRFYYFNNR